jgi:hypothetical protein
LLRRSVLAVPCAVLLAFPAAAEAATVGIRPVKSCYRAGEQTFFGGSGFTPNGAVSVTADGSSLGSLSVASNGAFGGSLGIGLASGEKLKTYTATDQVDPSIAASTRVRVSALDVSVRPRRGRPGRRVRVKARGFTTGKRLYAHIRRGRRYKKNRRIGRLKGACRKLSKRTRFFSRRTPAGIYTVQFDTKRRYSRRTAVKLRFSVTVFHTVRASASAASAPERWVKIR